MKKIFIFIIVALTFLFFILNSGDQQFFGANDQSKYLVGFKEALHKINTGLDEYFTQQDREEFKRNFSNAIYKIKNIITDEELAKIKQRASELFKEINNAIWNNLNDSEFEKALVKRVVDGDTIVVILNGLEEKVRLIGVNTPESAGKYKNNPQDYGKESSDFTKRSLLGRVVYFEKDVGDKDKYGRLLRYVWLTEPSNGNLEENMFNAILVSEGYAKVMTIQPNVKYKKTFTSFEKKARNNKKGLWKLK